MRKGFPLALFCSIAALGVTNANAETVEFNGDVTASCTISNVSNGTLITQLPDTLSSTSGGGVTATFNVSNNSPNTFKVIINDVNSFDAAPANLPSPIAFTTASRISDGANSSVDNRTILTDSKEYELINEGEDTFSVDLTAFAQASGATFPVGSYTASTTVTCTTL